MNQRSIARKDDEVPLALLDFHEPNRTRPNVGYGMRANREQVC